MSCLSKGLKGWNSCDQSPHLADDQSAHLADDQSAHLADDQSPQPAGDRSLHQAGDLFFPLALAGDQNMDNLICDICSDVFSNKKHLKRHKANHLNLTNGIKFTCEICLKVYGRKDNLMAHKKKQHSDL